MSHASVRMHEVEFCGDVKSLCDALFASRPDWPFSGAKIEQYGVGNYRRSDLRFFRKGSETPFLCGEVKMPGTPEGRSPYDDALMRDAFQKADNIQCPYFFTWNVNRFVLFDRSKWQVPMIERRMRDWDLGLQLRSSTDCRRPEVMAAIRDRFLPDVFDLLADILAEKVADWGLPPDLLFIRSLETHLEWPVDGTTDYFADQCANDNAFATKLKRWMTEDMGWTFDPENMDDWRGVLDRASRTLCYVFCNRSIFYEAIRIRYPGRLEPLVMPQDSRSGHEGIYQYFRAQFHRATIESGDYEPIFYPDVEDKVGALIFASPIARQGWLGVFTNLGHYNFREIPYDVIGGIFQRLIAPEERQKFGQFFTGEDIVDIINAFCIRRAGDKVIDPSCGSGSFLIRAYLRKAWLSEQSHGRKRTADTHLSHQRLLGDIYGCDIALFAAHLATLNLAARQITDEENYPFIARGNFFEVAARRERFCRIPAGLRNPDGTRDRVDIPLPDLDAVVGNPPYIRQETLSRRSEIKKRSGEKQDAFISRQKNTKDHFRELAGSLWPGLKLSGRSDLHCYFWPVAANLLKEGGHFGFLTSSSWFDVEYGFALQRWILLNFKIVAILESLDEPWFTDARVKTAITILQRCENEQDRAANPVRFVRLNKPVRVILGEGRGIGEQERQGAVEHLRKEILKTAVPKPGDPLAIRSTPDYRIITLRQSDLWKEGVHAWDLLKRQTHTDTDQETGDETDVDQVEAEPATFTLSNDTPDYAAGKWGRYLRAPDLYFRLIREYGTKFVRLGEVAEVKRGVTSGCDAFFMPRDVTGTVLEDLEKGLPWQDVGLMTPCKRKEIEQGKVRIIRAGDNTLHPIERAFIRPEVHSLMQVERPVIREADCDRVVLWVGADLKDIVGTYVAKYIRWGARQTFASKKSKPVPVPERSTCAARARWYDLTTDAIGICFWPKAQKYRHIIPANPEELVCNCNLYTLVPMTGSQMADTVLPAILNSTLVALMKCFYGRYAGTEGTLKTEVVDTVLLDIPDPRGVSARVAARIQAALAAMSGRTVTHMVQESMLACHDEAHMRTILARPAELAQELQQADRRELDDAVLEMIGIQNETERRHLLDELYAVTAEYYRFQRTQDIQASRNRAGNNQAQTGPRELAASIWDSLADGERGLPVLEWIRQTWAGGVVVEIPDGRASAVGAADMFDPAAVIFRQGGNSIKRSYVDAEQAALVAILANLEVRGDVYLPASEKACRECRGALASRLAAAKSRFNELSAARTGQVAMQEKVVFILTQWHTHGHPSDSSGGNPS